MSDGTYDSLKARHRTIRDGHPPSLRLRIHRALSWLDRAERSEEDHDAAFIFYWIAFNAAYANDLSEATANGERSTLKAYFHKLTDVDREHRIYDAIWERFPQSVRVLLENRYLFAPFIDLMMQNPEVDWGAPHYPVVQ